MKASGLGDQPEQLRQIRALSGMKNGVRAWGEGGLSKRRGRYN